MESQIDFHTARALLEWQIELGATDAIGDTPVNRYDLPDKLRPVPKVAAVAAETASPAARPRPKLDPVEVARTAAQAAPTIEALRAAMDGFEHCELKKGARNLVFADGAPGAPVMIIGEAPGREEDREGRPFVGPAGHLLDRMLAAIGMSRQVDVYITNVMPWRPPQNREPRPDEIAMMKPFLERHVALIDPKVIVLMGNVSCQAVLGKRGITRLRGSWEQALGKPVLPMVHPAHLLRHPAEKREAWADLLEVRAKLK
ncbi:uracil-DNA glycosylase [Antarcticimicrobium sediminis]|uniref:Type-4 uracil-DNA glycosylase n=1 Tax=Antarcticimicrobium sediminis TaxID=2546227 RepID=A0A4R5EXQ8_9RHOB|nr:uracil-DNA glycosylase [Antarcticimicrobium sediminis]TDE39781.1 uracil-DNA glycosylase [Antarcticimicrobium sediminis]